MTPSTTAERSTFRLCMLYVRPLYAPLPTSQQDKELSLPSAHIAPVHVPSQAPSAVVWLIVPHWNPTPPHSRTLIVNLVAPASRGSVLVPVDSPT